MIRAALLAVLLFTSGGTGDVPDLATELSEVADLAERAMEDPSARRQLAEVTDIDGDAVDLGPLLEGSEEEILLRLQTLAHTGDAAAVDTAGAAEDADQILSESRFKGLDRAAGPSLAERSSDWLFDRIPAPISRILGSWGFWVMLGVVVVAFSLLRTRWSGSASGRDLSVAGHVGTASVAAPGDLERDADAAESAGDFMSAVRLRFRAGLCRLRTAGLIGDESTTSAGQLRSVMPGPDVDRLSRTFERIVYGKHPATAADAVASRRDWQAALAAVGGNGG
jgi:hypothetical protein